MYSDSLFWCVTQLHNYLVGLILYMIKYILVDMFVK